MEKYIFIFICLGIQSGDLSQQVNKAPVWHDYLENKLAVKGLLENLAVGTKLGQLNATDPENQEIRYKCISKILKCSDNGTVFLKSELDREDIILQNEADKQQQLLATFEAYDTVSGQLNEDNVNSVQVVIFVRDVNDNSPEFENIPYKIDIPENTPVGTTVFEKVSIQDRDSGDNAEVDLTCYKADAEANISCEHFSINAVHLASGKYSGKVVLKKTVDYESRNSYKMTLKAVDRGVEKRLTASVNILIDIIDQQDTGPIFSNSPYTFYLDENAKVGTTVGCLEAHDGDKDQQNPVRISITSDPKNSFRLGASSLTSGNSNCFTPVITKVQIDREKDPGPYVMHVKAVELVNNTETHWNTTNTVFVRIKDANDNPPRFNKTLYDMEILELDDNASKDQLIGFPMLVFDIDTPSNAHFNLSIINQTFRDVFSVSPQSVTSFAVVNLLVKNPSFLNYDIPSHRTQQVMILAQQTGVNVPPLNSTTTVLVKLKDLNDNPPVFKQRVYQTSVFETANINDSIIIVSATDKDEGKNAEISYTLDGGGSEFFHMDENSGLVILKKSLDFEQISLFSLYAVARNKVYPYQTGRADIVINITDVNDNGPVFTHNNYKTQVRETSSLLQPVITVQATDKDTNNVLLYKIISGNTPDNAFRINPTTGVLSLSRGLNLSETSKGNGIINLVVEVVDNGSPPLNSNATVTVTIEDINNNAPQFKPQTYSRVISELKQANDPVITLTATDKDLGSNAQISYFITDGSFDHFEIRSNSDEIFVASPSKLDYDSQSHYNITVEGVDHGSPPLTGTATVYITLEDENNKKPIFDKAEYLISISENTTIGSSVLRVTATDNDVNSVLEYKILKSSITATNPQGKPTEPYPFKYMDAFTINKSTGVIYTKIKLQHVYASLVSFNVRVEDKNAGNGSEALRQRNEGRVIVIILPSKKTKPYFVSHSGLDKPVYVYVISEDKHKGLRITTLIAKDPITSDSIAMYRKVPGGKDFNYTIVNNAGEIILAKSLDYENLETNPLVFDVEAITNDSRKALATIKIFIQDVNDNVPHFLHDSYEITVPESRRYPFLVGSVRAIDDDTGSFSTISYSLEGRNSEDFLLQPNLGSIVVQRGKILDYEKKPLYQLQVTATDNPTGETHQKSVVKLVIKITDVNDNAPVFTLSNYTFYTVETLQSDSSVGIVEAHDEDADLNGAVTYSVNSPVNSKDEAIFDIIESTGLIMTRVPLTNREVDSSPFQFTVTATDKGLPSQSGTALVIVVINSGSINNGMPRFLFPSLDHVLRISENSPLGLSVGQVRAKSQFGNNITYGFLNNDGNKDFEKFRIDPRSGNITVAGPLDRETKEILSFIVTATDSKNKTLKSSHLLLVELIDVDDNIPSFNACSSQIPFTASVRENEAVNVLIIQLTACDLDEPPYNSVGYKWKNYNYCDNSRPGFSAFALNRTTGAIYSNALLDHEDKDSYKLCVQAFTPNSGRARRSASAINETLQVAVVDVLVIDINDNGPQFSKEEYSVVIYEKTVVETSIITVTAVDPDSSPNNEVIYSISNIYYHLTNKKTIFTVGPFIINSQTGLIVTNLQDYISFVWGYFSITVRAEDKYNKKLYSTVLVKVFIIQSRERIRFVFNGSPTDNREKAQQLMKDLNALGDMKYSLKEINYHKTRDYSYDFQKTDVCFVIIRENKVISISEGRESLNSAQISEKLKKYAVSETGSCDPETTDTFDGWQALWWVLVAFAILIFICCVILIITICILYKWYKNYMETKETYLLSQ